MKKHLFYAGLAALALASCSQDETTSVDQSGAIGFRTALDKATRSVTTKANMGSFNVTAFKADNTAANYFTDLEVKSTDNGNTWNTTKTYYWPAYDLKFTAYAPTTPGGTVTINKDGQKITDFQPESSIKQQKDVVVAFNQGGKTAYGASGVPMYFKHILSQIEVKAKCVNENLVVKVVGVKLGNVLKKATFTFPQAKTEASVAVPFDNWTATSEKTQFGVSDASKAVTLDTEAKSIMFDETSDKTNNFLMIPQQLEAYAKGTKEDGAYIAVLCQISSKDGSNLTRLYPAEGENAYAYSAVAINTKWEPGKKYIYTLTYGAGDGNGGGGIVPPNQDNPDPDNPVNPTVPQDPTPHNPGDPILDAPIKFTVEEVEVWSNQEEALSM